MGGLHRATYGTFMALISITCQLAYTATVQLAVWRCSTLGPVSTEMGDRLRAGIPPRYLTKPTRSTQPCIPPGSLNRVPALIGWGKGRNVTSAGWQVTLCDPVRHVTSRSGEAVCELLYSIHSLLTYLLNYKGTKISNVLTLTHARTGIHLSYCIGCWGLMTLSVLCDGGLTTPYLAYR